MKHLLLLTMLVLSLVWVAASTAGTQDDAKFALHVQTVSKTPCDVSVNPVDQGIPCSSYTTTMPMNEGRNIYVVVAQADPVAGISGASFGVTYDVNALVSWSSCADIELPTANWPQPGSGNTLSFIGCENTVIGGDGAHVVLGAFYISSYLPDVFQITGNRTQTPPALLVSDCSAEVSVIHLSQAGNVGIGSNPGYNPCTQLGTGSVWQVPGQAATIQAAIDSASLGDTVLVACGTYYEHDIDLKNGVTLLSATGEADCVTIDAQAQGRVMRADGVHQPAEVKGFTLTGGFLGGDDGGALRVQQSSLRLLDCRFENNVARYGGGLYVQEASPVFENCVVAADSAESIAGGVRLYFYAFPTFISCTFNDNVTLGDGGGVHMDFYCEPTFQNCTFRANRAGNGSGIFSNNGSLALVRNSIIADGLFTQAVSCVSGAVPTLSCTDIYNNYGGDWFGLISSQSGINGNFSLDPEFCGPSGTGPGIGDSSPCAPAQNPGCGLVGAGAVECFSLIPVVNHVTPASSRNVGTFVADIVGTNLDTTGFVAKLDRLGSGVIIAQSIVEQEPGRVRATFDVDGEVPGAWDLQVTNVTGADTLESAVVLYAETVDLFRSTTNPYDDRAPAFPLPGALHDSLAFLSDRAGGASEIYIKSALVPDTLDLNRITTSGAQDPCWSPDGETIVYGNEGPLYLVDADSGAVLGPTLFLSGANGNPSWSPDGYRIAFDRDDPEASIFTYFAAGYGLLRITRPGADIDTYPSWSPDGARLAFNRMEGLLGSSIHTQVAFQDTASRIEVVPVDTGKHRRDVAWSPDGRWIAYAERDGASPHDIFVVDARGRDYGFFTITTDAAADDVEPAWSPDGLSLAFASDRSGNYDIYVASNLPCTDDEDGDWVPDSIDACPSFATPGWGWDHDEDGCVDSTASFRSVRSWARDQVPTYEFTVEGDPRISDGSDETAVAEGFAVWRAIPNTSLPFDDDIGSAEGENATSGDGVNTITFGDPDAFIPGLLGMTPVTTVVGDTLIDGRWYRPGEILDADMLFNSLYYKFNTATNNFGPGAYDLKSLTIHEAGHFFGLSHSCVVDHSMFYVLFAGAVDTTLHEDDIALARRTYPDPGLPPSLSAEGLILRSDGVTPIVGAAVLALSDATGDTLRMTLSDWHGVYRFYDLTESYRIYTLPLDGGSEANGLVAAAVNDIYDDWAETDFLAEYWDNTTEANDDFDGTGYVITGAPLYGADIVVNADLTGPSVVSVYPANTAGSIPATTAITVKFDEKIDLNSVSGSTFDLRDASEDTVVSGVATVLQQDSLLVFTPDAPLKYHDTYELTVGPGILDIWGNSQVSPSVTHFYTENQPPVTLTSASPGEAPVGGALVLHGTGFDPVAANNLVDFAGGATAYPYGATIDRLFVIVPQTAESGSLRVRVNAVPSNYLYLGVVPPQLPPSVNFLDQATLGATVSSLAMGVGGHYAYVGTGSGVTAVKANPTAGGFLNPTPMAIGGGTRDVAAMPDGQRVLAVGPTQPRLWALDTDTASVSFHTPAESAGLVDVPLAIEILPGGAQALIVYAGRVVMHDVASGATFGMELREWSQSGVAFTGDLAVSPGGEEAYASTAGGRLAVLGLNPGEGILDLLLDGKPSAGQVVAPDGGAVYSLDGVGGFRSFAQRGALLQQFSHEGGYRGCAVSPEGSFVYAANYIANCVDIIDVQGGTAAAVDEFTTGIDPVAVATAQAGRYLYVLTAGANRLEVFDTQDAPSISLISPVAGGEGTLVTVVGTGFDPVAGNNTVMIGNSAQAADSANAAGTVLMATLPSGVLGEDVTVSVAGKSSNVKPFRVVDRADPGGFEVGDLFGTDGSGIGALAMSPDGRLIFVGQSNGGINVVQGDPDEDTLHRPIQKMSSGQTNLLLSGPMAVSPAGDRLYVGNYLTGKVHVFTVNYDGLPALQFSHYVRNNSGDALVYMERMAFSPDGTRMFMVSATGDRLYEATTAADSVVAAVEGFNAPSRIAVHPSGQRAYVGDYDGVRVVDIASESAAYRTILETISIPNDVYELACAPNGEFLLVMDAASEPDSYDLRVVDTITGSGTYHIIRYQTSLGPGSNVMGMAVNHTGSVVYVTEPDGTGMRAFAVAGLSEFGLLTSPAFPARGTPLVSADDARLLAVHTGSDSLRMVSLTPTAGLSLVAGDGQVAVAGESLPVPITARVAGTPAADMVGNPVTFQAVNGGGFGFTDEFLYAVADDGGLVSAEFTAGTLSGLDTVLVRTGSAQLLVPVQVVADTSLAAPQLISTAPAVGAGSPPGVNTVVWAQFSKAVNPASVMDTTFYVHVAGNPYVHVQGTYTFVDGGRRVVINPSVPLNHLTAYDIVVTGGIQDYSANPLSNPGTGGFVTGAPPALKITGVDPPAAVVGHTVVISGAGYSSIVGDNDVFFGNLSTTPQQANPQSLVVKVPGGTVSAPLRVQVGAGLSNPVGFQVVVPATQPVNDIMGNIQVPNSGQMIAVTPDGVRAYMTSSGANTVVPILIGPRVSETAIPVGLHPFGVTTSPNGDRIYVTNFLSNDVSVVDGDPSHGTFHTVIKNIPVGLNPTGVAAHPDGRTLYVVNYGGNSLSFVDTDSTSASFYSARAAIPVDNSAQTVVVTPDGSTVIVGTATQLLFLDAADGSARAALPTDSTPKSVTVTPDGAWVIVLTTDAQLILIDIAPGSSTQYQARAALPTDNSSQSVTVSPDGAFVYVVTADGQLLTYTIVSSGGSGGAADAAFTPYQIVLLDTQVLGENLTQAAFDRSGSGQVLVLDSGAEEVLLVDALGVAVQVPETNPVLRFNVLPAFPNPFRSSTRIAFELTDPTEVTADLFSVTGALVRRLSRDRLFPAGRHVLRWDGRDDRGQEVGTGVYFLRVVAGDHRAETKMLRLR